MALLLRGGLLITMNAERAVLTADILVEGDRIAALAPDLPPADSAGCAAGPGRRGGFER